MLERDAGRDVLSGGADYRQGVGSLVIRPRDVVKLAAVEVAAELLDEEPVRSHVRILGVPGPRRLLHDEVGVAVAHDALDTNFFGDADPVDERLVLCYVVGGREVYLEDVVEPVSFWRGEDDAGAQAPRILEPSKCMRQSLKSSFFGTYWVSAQSTRKSART